MVLICISLMISGVEYLFMPVGYLHFLFGKMSIQVFCPFFLSDCFYFLMLSCMSSFQRSFNREQNDKLKKYVHNSRFSGKRKKLVSKTSFLLGKEAKEEKGSPLCLSNNFALMASCSSCPLFLPPFYLPATTNTTTTITHTPSSIDCYAPTRSQLFLGATWVRSSMIYFHDTIFLFFKALISFCILYISGIVWLTYLSLVKPMRTNLYLLNNPVSLEYRPVLETCCCCC